MDKNKLKMKNELLRTIKFVLFSIGAGIIQVLSCTLLNELANLHYWTSYLISLKGFSTPVQREWRYR